MGLRRIYPDLPIPEIVGKSIKFAFLPAANLRRVCVWHKNSSIIGKCGKLALPRGWGSDVKILFRKIKQPFTRSFWRRASCQTESNTFSTSFRTTLLSWWEVEWATLNPNWWSSKILTVEIKPFRRFKMILSKTLLIELVRLFIYRFVTRHSGFSGFQALLNDVELRKYLHAIWTFCFFPI
jgi:hypothetical protein